MANELVKGNAELLVLRVLALQPRHGYGVMQAIRQKSEGRLTVTEGSVYPLLHRLERDGLLLAEWETQPSGRRRKVYQVTPAGMERLKEAAEEWHRFRAGMDSVLGLGEGAPEHG